MGRSQIVQRLGGCVKKCSLYPEGSGKTLQGFKGECHNLISIWNEYSGCSVGNGQKRKKPERGAVVSQVTIAIPEGRALAGGRGEREKYTDLRGKSGEESDTGPTLWATHLLTQDVRTRMSLEDRVLSGWQAYCKPIGSSGDCGILRSMCPSAKGQLLLNARLVPFGM